MGSIYISQPWWYLIACVLAGLVVALVLYYKAPAFKEKPLFIRAGLATLRGMIVSIICFLLLAPLLKQIETDIKKPILVFLLDGSESISMGTDKSTLEQLEGQLNALKEELKDHYEIEELTFGNNVRTGLNFGYTDKETDLEQALRYTKDAFDQQRLGAVFVLSDGLYNRGTNPIYSTHITKAPIYTVALGDPTPVRDLALKRLFHNKVAYKGDKFTVQLDILARNAKGEKSELKVYDITSGGPRQLVSQPILIDQDPYFQTREIQLEALESGVRRYRFTLSGISEEKNTVNNSRDMYIEVLDARKKILVIADAPHPDLSALRQSLASSGNYLVDVRFAKDQGQAIKTYDLVIFHQMPSIRNSGTSIFQEAKQARVPHWFILGSQSNIPAFNNLQKVLSIRGDGKNLNDVQGIFAPEFQVFTLSDALKNRIPQFPPILAPFGDYSAEIQSRSMLHQRIGSVNTSYPLWIFGELDQIKIGILAGEGIWRWRMFDFLQHANFALVDELVLKTVNYLAVHEDKRRLRVQPSRQLFKENEQLHFDGELYNEAFELITEPDIQVIIKNEESREFVFVMNKSSSLYSLQAGIFPPGNYSFVAKATHNLQNLTYEGRFSIEPVDQEQADLQADHNLLQLLAAESGGKMVNPAQLPELQELIRNNQEIKPVMYSSIQSKPLIHWKWLFALLILLLSGEWFIRRYLGSY